MARSLRSKWGRKMRAIKRVRYGEKEKVMLVNMLNAAKAAQDPQAEESSESQFMVVRPPNATPGEVETDVTMAELSKYDPKTLKDEHGNYPVWMNQRRIRKQKKIVNKSKKKNNNKQRKRV